MRLRPAYYTDEKLLFEWRKQDEENDWWHGDGVTEDGHERWLHQRLTSPSVQLFVAEVDSLLVGQLRVDSNGEISYSVDKNHRNHGYGKEMVTLGTRMAASLHGRVKANVDKSNEAGIRTLLSAGFVLRDDVAFYRFPK